MNLQQNSNTIVTSLEGVFTMSYEIRGTRRSAHKTNKLLKSRLVDT